jgi:hypothetical protein
MTITSTGSNSGVTLASSAGWTFLPAGIGTESVGNSNN